MGTLLDLVHTHHRGLETGDLDLSATVFDEDVVTQMPFGILHGLAEFRGLGEAFVAAVPDMKLTITKAVELGDTVVIEGIYSGTQTGPLQTPGGEIPPTGRAFSFPYVDVFVARDGKFVEHRGYWDNVTFMTQLGLMPEPASA